MTESAPRPRKVTFACLAAGVGAFVVLLSCATTLADWVSPEIRDQAEAILSEPPLDDSGITVGQLLEAMRIALMVGAAMSAAVIVLAIHTAKGHRGARVVLTIASVLAGIVFLPAGLAGVLPAAMAVGAAVLLWSREANAWFNPEKVARAESRSRVTASAERVTSAPESGETRPVQPGEPRPVEPSGPRAADVPFGSEPTGRRAAPPSPAATWPLATESGSRRLPGTVLAAVLTASIMSGVVMLGSAMVLVEYASSPVQLGTELLSYPALADNPQVENLGWSARELGRIVLYAALALLVLSVAAIATALWMLRRSNAARIVLVVLSGMTIALSLVATLAGIPWIAAAITVIVLLFRPSANDYFGPAGARRGRRP